MRNHHDAAALDHRVDALGYRIQDEPRTGLDGEELARRGITGPLVGRLLRQGRVVVNGRVSLVEDVTVARRCASFAFVQDTRPCEGALRLADGVDTLVMEATYLDDLAGKADEYGHSTALATARLAARAGAARLILTHFSARYTGVDAHLAEAAGVHGNVLAVNDLDKVDLD